MSASASSSRLGKQCLSSAARMVSSVWGAGTSTPSVLQSLTSRSPQGPKSSAGLPKSRGRQERRWPCSRGRPRDQACGRLPAQGAPGSRPQVSTGSQWRSALRSWCPKE
eukprot:6355765-Alexandrium_andersonii.AAC.1